MNGKDESPEATVTPANADAMAQATRRTDVASEAPVRLDTAALFAGRNEVRLLHRGQEYRLRVTRQGKLILTK